MSKTKATQTKTEPEVVAAIQPPHFRLATMRIIGTAPLVQLRMSMKMPTGAETGVTKKKRAPRDYESDFRNAPHVSSEGWYGIPAGAIRRAMVDVCRAIDYKMTLAKLCVFVEADGIDKEEGTPLIKLDVGEPEMAVHPVRNFTGVLDWRARAMWREWSMVLRIKYDADKFKVSDIVNLISQVGVRVGLGEGRPYSKDSTGMGWGTFTVDYDNIKDEEVVIGGDLL